MKKRDSPEITTEYRIWRYGPDKEAPSEMHELWANVLKDIERRHPLTAPILLAEAKRKKISPLEMRFFMAHNEWVEKREEISEKRHKWMGKKYRSVLKEGYAHRLDVINEDRSEKIRRRLEGQHGVV